MRPPAARAPLPSLPACVSPLPFRIRPSRATLVQCPCSGRQHRLRVGRDVTRRKHLLTAARLLASFGMLAYLLSRFTSFNLSALLPAWHASTLAWLLSGLALTGAAIVLAAARWQRVADVLQLRSRLSTFVS